MLSVLLCTLVISGCASDKLVVSTKATERVSLNIDVPEPISAEYPKWYVVTKTNVNPVISEIVKDGSDPMMYGVSPDGFEQLSQNLILTRIYIVKLREILQKYKDYYEPTQK